MVLVATGEHGKAPGLVGLRTSNFAEPHLDWQRSDSCRSAPKVTSGST